MRDSDLYVVGFINNGPKGQPAQYFHFADPTLQEGSLVPEMHTTHSAVPDIRKDGTVEIYESSTCPCRMITLI